MYIIYNYDGSIKATNFAEFIQKGNDNVNFIFVAIEGRTRSEYTCYATFTLPTEELGGPLTPTNATFNYNGVPYNGYKLPITAEVTQYAGIVKLSVVLTDRNEPSSVLYTYPVKLTINDSSADLQTTKINLSQYINLLGVVNQPAQSVEVTGNTTILELYQKIGLSPTFINVKNVGFFLAKIDVGQQNPNPENQLYNIEAERWSGGITAGQDRYTATGLPSDTALGAIFNSSSIYSRPYLVTNVPVRLTDTIESLYARISNKPAIINLKGDHPLAGHYLIKLDNYKTEPGGVTLEMEKIGLGNNPQDEPSARFIIYEDDYVDPETTTFEDIIGNDNFRADFLERNTFNDLIQSYQPRLYKISARRESDDDDWFIITKDRPTVPTTDAQLYDLLAGCLFAYIKSYADPIRININYVGYDEGYLEVVIANTSGYATLTPTLSDFSSWDIEEL